jgi:hypothetical protein
MFGSSYLPIRTAVTALCVTVLLLALPVFAQGNAVPLPRLEVYSQSATVGVGQTLSLPLRWTGAKPWHALQAKITLGDGLAFVSTTPGPLYVAAGCGAAVNAVDATTIKVAWACPHGSGGDPIVTLNLKGLLPSLDAVAVWQCQIAEVGDAQMHRCLGGGGLVTVTGAATAKAARVR